MLNLIHDGLDCATVGVELGTDPILQQNRDNGEEEFRERTRVAYKPAPMRGKNPLEKSLVAKVFKELLENRNM